MQIKPVSYRFLREVKEEKGESGTKEVQEERVVLLFKED